VSCCNLADTTLVATAFTQQTQRTSLPGDKPQPKVAAPERNTEEILLARSVADKILGLHSLKPRTFGTARLAALLWKDDQAYARMTFAMARAEELKNEDLRARALIEVAGVHLQKVASKPKKATAEQRKNAPPSQPQSPGAEKQPN
jgi:hypothetical protein